MKSFIFTTNSKTQIIMTINCNGKLIDLTMPKVMGILNITPNSFYDGGSFSDEKSILKQVEKMLVEGASFIDIGAYSSKPKADFVSEEEELQRLIPVIILVLKHFPESLISVDTFRANVAKTAVENGACIINDISAGNLDNKMMETVAKLHVPYIIHEVLREYAYFWFFQSSLVQKVNYTICRDSILYKSRYSVLKFFLLLSCYLYIKLS